jgi:transposase
MSNNVYVGIDASKGYSDFIVLQQNKEVAEQAFRLYDVSEGYNQLDKLLDSWVKKGYDHIYCGVESTGGYENNWVNYLQQVSTKKPVSIVRLNPKGVKSLGEAALRRTVTDSISAENIALYLIDFHHKIHYLQPSLTSRAFVEGRKHNSFIRMLKKQYNQLGNQLEKHLYEHFSPLMCYCRHGQPVWLLRLLEKYPSVVMIKKAGCAKVSKIKGISVDKANSIFEKLVPVKVILLTSITGIGEQSAVEIIVEIEDINRFENAKKIGAYFGIHPMWKQSGDGTWGNHMSKKGRAEIRAVLYMCCMSAIRHDEMFKTIYSKARSNGKNHFSAMGVVMNKMLRIIYGVLKNRTEYNRETDYKNQQQAKEKQAAIEKEAKDLKKEKQTRLERFNDADNKTTPVSKRHAKKKRQGPKLQIEECTGSPAS